MKILLTGAASHLARALLPALLAREDVEIVIGLDWREGFVTHPRYRHRQVDLREAPLAEILTDIDTVIHLAFAVIARDADGRRLSRATRRAINVTASARLFAACLEAGVERLLCVSSAAVYGPQPDERCVPESAPRRPLAGFAYAEDKAAMEAALDALQDQPHGPRVIRLRPHVILGPHCQPLLRRMLAQPFYLAAGRHHPLQCVHEDDVARALLLALDCPRSATFNIAADDALPFADMLRLRHSRAWPLPRPLAVAGHALLRSLSPAWGERGILESLCHPLVVCTERAKRELGWRACYSTRDCITHM
ncbi:MAG TPA: NAD-dependent epimerase/dehydratase family protein [Gammaproteobacteria bacterium]|nr:NAD-dependent epimerase/dehydratase family protein [Gammaproteobacteria bacterium]